MMHNWEQIACIIQLKNMINAPTPSDLKYLITISYKEYLTCTFANPKLPFNLMAWNPFIVSSAKLGHVLYLPSKRKNEEQNETRAGYK